MNIKMEPSVLRNLKNKQSKISVVKKEKELDSTSNNKDEEEEKIEENLKFNQDQISVKNIGIRPSTVPIPSISDFQSQSGYSGPDYLTLNELMTYNCRKISYFEDSC